MIYFKLLVILTSLAFLGMACTKGNNGTISPDPVRDFPKPTPGPAGSVRLLYNEIGLGILGSGLTDAGEYARPCGKGTEMIQKYEKPEIIYRIRTYPLPENPGVSALVSELVIVNQHTDYADIENKKDEQFS